MSIAQSMHYIYPELILLIASLAILILGVFIRKKNLPALLSLGALALAALYLPQSSMALEPLFYKLLVNDTFAIFFKALCLLVSFVVILISMGYKVFGDDDRGEYYFLLLTVTIAMLLAVSSNNLLMIYIALEAVSLVSYILVGFLKRDTLSNEGALKYFLFGVLSTGIMLYGISFVYGLFGTTDLASVAATLAGGAVNKFAVLISLILILAGIGFKCALVPFHMWVPDVYQGAPTPITAFISVGPKAVGFAILIRVFFKNFFPLFQGWVDLFTVIAIFTITVGNITALSQTNIKRMFGYSSIAQAGYILIGFVAGTSLGIKAVLFYILAYMLMNLGAFGCIILVSNSIKSDLIEHYAGLYKRDPVTACMFAAFLLSLAGIPPLAGFLGKFFVFSAAIESKFILLTVVALINSVIALYYYVKVIKYMYLEEPKTQDIQPKSMPLQIALMVLLAGIVIVGVWPNPILHWIARTLP